MADEKIKVKLSELTDMYDIEDDTRPEGERNSKGIKELKEESDEFASYTVKYDDEEEGEEAADW